MRNFLLHIAASAALLCTGVGMQATPAIDNLSSEIVKNEPSVRVIPGGLELTSGSGKSCHFAIYSITGQLVKQITITDSSVTIDLPQGYYIVKCNEWSKKVIVK